MAAEIDGQPPSRGGGHGAGLSQKQTAAFSSFHEGPCPLLQFDQLEEEAEGPGNSWTAPRETSYLPASPFVNGFQPLSR